ncbi:MAG: 50S ribosomal protein L35ae [Nanoarchaeota archaeon]|nr:50S ribosomal protein L35ae [Nanoarchaeota archaeon]
MPHKGKVIQFRRGLKRIHEKHFILDVGAKSKEDAKKFAGKEVVWTSPSGKKLKGKISDSHGNKGLVRAIFEIGLPGQARNTEVVIDSILESENKTDNAKPKGVK